MGIDFSHGEARWAYSGFMRFRSRISETLGYGDLKTMYDEGSHTAMQDEPIYPLINHSDCDGELTVKEMEMIIPQLESILTMWADKDKENVDGDVLRGRDLVEGMKDAIESDEVLEFI